MRACCGARSSPPSSRWRASTTPTPETRFFDEGPAARARQAVIPAADAAVFRERIDDMKAIFADEDRSDWFDADGMARDIAESLDLLLAAQGF